MGTKTLGSGSVDAGGVDFGAEIALDGAAGVCSGGCASRMTGALEKQARSLMIVGWL